MKYKTLFLLITALLCPLAARAQSTTQTAPQAANQGAQQPGRKYSSLDDDPAFKRLSQEQQDWVRSVTERLNKAVAEKDVAAIDQIQRDIEKHQQANPGAATVSAPPKTASPNSVPAPNAQAGCAATPVKKPRFHLPRTVQDAINTGKLSDMTGIDLDPNAKDKQGKPCPATPAPAPKAKK